MRGDREEEEVGQGGEEEEDNNEESIRSDVASSERSDTSVHQSNESGTGRTSGSTRRSSSRSGSTSGGREQSGETNTGGEVCLILNNCLRKMFIYFFRQIMPASKHRSWMSCRMVCVVTQSSEF